MRFKLGGDTRSVLTPEQLSKPRPYKRQNSLILPKAQFARVLRQVSAEEPGFRNSGLRWGSTAVEALQTGVEKYLIGLFEDANSCALHATRLTIFAKDMALARRIRGRFESLPAIIHSSS